MMICKEWTFIKSYVPMSYQFCHMNFGPSKVWEKIDWYLGVKLPSQDVNEGLGWDPGSDEPASGGGRSTLILPSAAGCWFVCATWSGRRGGWKCRQLFWLLVGLGGGWKKTRTWDLMIFDDDDDDEERENTWTTQILWLTTIWISKVPLMRGLKQWLWPKQIEKYWGRKCFLLPDQWIWAVPQTHPEEFRRLMNRNLVFLNLIPPMKSW